MRSVFFKLLFLLVFPAVGYAQKEAISPDYYKASAIPDSLKANATSVVRYFKQEVTVRAPGKAVVKEHLIQTLLNEKAEKEAVFVLFYNRKFSDVEAAELIVYDSNGKLIKRYRKNDFYDRSAYEDISIITDGRFLGVSHSIVSYPVTVEKISETNFSSFLDLPDWNVQPSETAVQYSSCKVSVRPSIGLRYKLKNFKSRPLKSRTADFDVYTWELRNLKAIKPEEDSEDWTFLPRVCFATNQIDFDDLPGDMTSWKSYGLWQQKLNAGLDVLSEERTLEIRKMVEGISSDREKARFLYEYLQKTTRYVSIQLGIGGLKPFAASFVDQKKYGDCKALTNYMHSLLKCVNIPSYYALVNAGENAEPADPDFVNDPFNHIILCIPFAGDTTWLECTNTSMPFGRLGSFIENRRALLITENGGKLVSTPRSVVGDNVFDSEARVKIATDGTATATMSIKSAGEYRDLLLGATAQKVDDQKEFFIRFLNLKQPDLLAIKESQDKNGVKEVALEMEYQKLSDLAAGGKFFYRPRLFDLWHLTLPAMEKRQTTFYFDHPMLKKNSTVFSFPVNLELETVPADVVLSFSEGGYQVNYVYDKEKNELRSTSRFEIKNHAIPASKYNEMQRFMDEVAKSLSKKMVLRKKI